mgnify:CR=1 FL=1
MKVVRQNGSMDCGACCLLSVIRHYGGNLPIEYLREMTATDRNGVSAYNLVHTAQEIGFSAYGLSGTTIVPLGASPDRAVRKFKF